MALIFPSNPTLNQVYSTGSLSWTWNGKSWNNGTSILATSNLVSSSVQFTNGNTNAFDTNSNITVGQITASFAKISGSIFGTASFATNAFSASYAPNIYVLPSNVVSASAQLSNGGGVSFDTNTNITVGQITASFAKITNLTVEYVTSSVMVITGSNKFGDASNDKQEFTGSVSMSGSLSVVGNVTSNNVLSLASGTVALPSLILSTDTTSGMYRIGANNIGISISAAKVLDISSTGLSVTGTLSASGGYNGTVGASTANTGAFTTLTASGKVATGGTANTRNLNVGNASSAYTELAIRSSAASTVAGGATIYFANATDEDEGWLNYDNAARTLTTRVAKTTVGTWSSTGLAVTGALSATGQISSGATSSNIGLQVQAGARIMLDGGGDTWIDQLNANEVRVIAGGSAIAAISSTGLAVTGALSSTTASNLCSTSGTLTVGSNTATAGGIIVNTSGTVGNMAYLNFKSAGTQCALFGLTGAALGTTATDALIFAETGKSINLWPNGGTTGVIINTSGNVGIGTSSPASKLHVYGSGEQYIYNQSTTAGCFFRQYPNSGSHAFIENGTVGSTIYFRTSASTSCDTSPVAISSTGLAVTGAVTATGNVGLAVGTLLTLNGNNTAASYALQAATAAAPYDFRIIGSSDSGTNRNFSFGYYASDDKTSTWNPKVTINSYTGAVGIGTTSPSFKLEIRNDIAASTSLETTAVKLYNNSDGGSGIEFSNSVGGKSKIAFGVIATGGGTDDTYIGFSTCVNAGTLTERARIDNSGNLLVGTTSADPSGSGSSGRVVVSTANGGQAALTAYNAGTGAVNIISLENGNGQVGRIQVNGSATSYLTSSDNRLKENVKPITDSSDIIDRLAPKKFDWKTGSKNAYGFIAQEAIEVFPEAVSAGDSEDEIKSPWAMDYSKLVPILVAELQSVRQRLAALEAK